MVSYGFCTEASLLPHVMHVVASSCSCNHTEVLQGVHSMPEHYF